MKVMYIDCSAGLSGSALLGALADLGVKPELLIKKIKSVLATPFQLKFDKIHDTHSTAATLSLSVDAGKEHVSATALIKSLIPEITPDDELRKKIYFFLRKFIKAQAKVEGLPVEEVVITEVKILRMAIIAAGFFTALAQLKIDRIIASSLPVGFHFFEQNFASLTLELAKGMSVRQYEGPDAPITPLGVALLNCSADEYGLLPDMLLAETGCGAAGEEHLKNIRVRILYGTVNFIKNTPVGPETITVAETAIDDMNPEFFPFLAERLRSGGAIDSFLTPIYMKKGRPALLLTVLCNRSKLEEVLTIIFNETTTLGIRIREDERRILARNIFKVSTLYGEVAIKAGYILEGGAPVQYAPEFEDCKKLALKHNAPVKEVYAAAQRAAFDYIKKHFQKSK